jgi:hypothetical protein
MAYTSLRHLPELNIIVRFSCPVQADELEWGAPGADDRVRRLAALKPHLVLAADCCYIDQDGESPSTPHFIQACKGKAVMLHSAALVTGRRSEVIMFRSCSLPRDCGVDK